MKPSHPLLFIGLDAAEPSLLHRWSACGALPTLAQLSSEGVQGAILNSPGIYTGSVWPSFHTGTNPGRHGRYFYRQLKVGTYNVTVFDDRSLSEPVFWKRLDDQQLKVAIVDLPKAPLVEMDNGIQLRDWGLHDSAPVPSSFPATLSNDVLDRFGQEPVGPCDVSMNTKAGAQGLCDSLLQRIEQKTEMVTSLLSQDDWDLFATAFGDSHCAGHQFWAIHDSSHPNHDANLLDTLGEDPLLKVYVALDKAIGRIIAAAGNRVNVVVLASHGMGAHYDGTFMLDDVLRRLDGSKIPDSTKSLRMMQRLWHKMPGELRTQLMPLSDRFYDALAGRGRSKRRCFVVPTNDNCAGIRINVKGREPNGIVQAGAEFDAYCDSLESDLCEIVNAETGAPMVNEVLRTAEHFPGKQQENLPDLLVRWNRSSPVRKIQSEKIGTIARNYSGIRSGDHRNSGWFYALGPDLATNVEVAGVEMIDFAPTIAALLGVELTGVDGAPIESLFRSGPV